MEINADASIDAREQALTGLAKTNKEFMEYGFKVLCELPPDEYSGEDIRIILIERGIKPNHPNTWGALIMKGIRKGILTDTGKTKNMRVKSSHARKTTIYIKISVTSGNNN